MATEIKLTVGSSKDSTISAGNSSIAVPSVSSSGSLSGYGTFDWKTASSTTFVGDAALSGVVSLTGSDATIVSADFNAATKGITFAGGDNIVTIIGGSGKDSLKAGKATKNIVAGAGNDTIVVEQAASSVTVIDAGDGNDYISLATIGSGASAITLGAGADTLKVSGGTVTVADYNYFDGDVINLVGSSDATVGATVALTSLGAVSVGNSSGTSVTGTVKAQDGWFAANVLDGKTDVIEYFTASGDKGVVSLDLSKSKAATVNIDTQADGATANLTLGKGAANVTLANGNDAADTIAVGKASTGAKTITNFGTEDVLSISGAKLSNVNFDIANKSDVVLTYASSTVSLAGIGAGGGEAFYIDNGSKNKVAFAGTDSKILYANSSDANWFVGTTDGKTTLEVGATTHLHETDKYKNINYIQVASDVDTSINLTGVTDKANTIDASAAKVGVGVWGYSTSADVISLGGGQDTVYFGSTDGADSISNFTFGSESDSDILYLYDTKTLGDIKVQGGKTAGSTGITAGKSTANVDGADGTNDIALIQLADGNVYTVAGAYHEADVITVDNDKTKALNYYAFNADKKQKVVITGSNTFAFNTTYTDFYTTGANVATVDASGASGNVTLAGAANIMGGSGTNEIWTYKSDANATVTAGDGTDHIWFADGFDKSVVVKSFDSDDDSIKFALAGSLKDIAEGYSFKVANGSDAVVTGTSGSKLTVEKNTEFSVSDGAGKTYQALVGTGGVAFADDVNIYGGMSTLTAGADIDGEVVVRVGKNSNGVASENYFIDDSVKVFDASKSAASFVIAGSSDHANTIKGGMTNNLLYGGGSSNDELVGSTEAKDIFFFGTGDGKDVVSGGLDSADSVSLWNVDDADIANITVTLKDDGSATVVLSDTSALNFDQATGAAKLIKDGLSFTSATNTAYKYDSETGKLVAKA